MYLDGWINLLCNLKIERRNQVWAMDITYVQLRQGFMYLEAIIDLKTKFKVGWSVSNNMSADWCSEILKTAIE